MQIPVEDIKVKKRLRKDLGDIEGLAESMKRLGQITPIVINKNNHLIAGGRRLEAAKFLGWRTINAVIADIPNEITILEYEIEENTQRQDFNSAELAEAARQLYHLRNPGVFSRIRNALAGFFKKLFNLFKTR
jgi:ParB family chromosome partitioning protein